jgi:quercetin dioxygenase-like cupin family protein
MDIKRNGTQPSSKGPAEWFTGSVRVDPLFEAPVPARALGVSVTFEPDARTAWHTHPLGQTLIVTSGCGRVQRWGGPIEEIRPGDVVWFAPGEKHWHGAAPLTAMTHIAIVEVLDGKRSWISFEKSLLGKRSHPPNCARLAARAEAVDRSDPWHHQAPSSDRKHRRRCGRTHAGRSTRLHEVRLQDQREEGDSRAR